MVTQAASKTGFEKWQDGINEDIDRTAL